MSRVVARGSLRVDARRAVAKLREHLLVDLHLYALEIVRAAIAGRATWVDVAHDAEDVTLTFDGDPLPAASLARLLDRVLDEGGSSTGRREHLLAIGVNAALGLDPAYVEVIVNGATCIRVRWTPALLEAGKLPVPEAIAVPEGAADLPAGAAQVRVRRRLGWGVLRAALGSAPREIDLLGAATFDLPIPLTLAGRPFLRPPRPSAILRVPFDVPGARRAALEILPAKAAPSMEFLERGVCLLSAPLDLLGALPRGVAGAAPLPVRAIVDADLLPTNASRSALREDAALPRLAAEAALRALCDAARALAAVGLGRGEVPPGVEALAADPTACEDAIGAVACGVQRAITAGAEVPAELREVLDLPLFRDGIGRPMSAREILPEASGVLHVFRGAEPLPEELGPWMRRVVWLRGRAAERMLSDYPTADATDLVERARMGAERRRRLSRDARGDPALPAGTGGPTPIRASFDVRDDDFAGLRGEVAILPEAFAPSRIHAFVEGVLLETIELDVSTMPLPIEAAIAWEGRVVPRLAYDGIERDQAFLRAVHYAAVMAVFALDRELARASAEARLHPAARAAIGAIVVGEERLGIEGIRHAPYLAAFKALRAAQAWPTSEPGRRESVASLGVSVAGSHALMTARPGALGRAPDGRPVITAQRREIAWLARALEGVAIVPYDAGLIAPGGEAAREALRDEALKQAMAAGSRGEPVLSFTFPGKRGLVAASLDPRITLCHAGRVLASNPVPPELGPIAVAIDDDSLVPAPGWDGLSRWRRPEELGAIERDHCERLVSALEGDPEARARLGCAGGVALVPSLRDYLLDRAGHLRRSDEGSAAIALADRIEGLPLLAMLDEHGSPAPVSPAAVARAHPAPAPIPVLRAPPGFETLAWRPLLVADDGELTAVARWSGGRAVRAEAAIPARLLHALTDRDRRAFLSGPEHDPRALGDLADAGGPSLFLDREALGGITVAVALPRAALGVERAWVDVLFRGRALCRRALPALPVPVVARVGLTDEAHVDAFRDLSEAGLQRVTERVHAAAAALALEIAARASAPGRGAALFGDLRALEVVRALLALDRSGPKELGLMLAIWTGASTNPAALFGGLPAALRSRSLLWPTVQGEDRPLDDLRAISGALYAGRARHVPWRGADPPSELDAPILCLPEGREGEALEAILGALDLRVRDVTGALAALAARRAVNASPEIPRLPGAPLHPALRVGLAELGLRFAEGELEVAPGPGSAITLIDIEGAPRAVKATMPFPVRIVARVDALDTGVDGDRALLRKLSRAANMHLVSLAPRLDELPEIVRAHLRGLVCKAIVVKKKLGRRAAEAPLFQDVGGAFHAFVELRARTIGTWECTNDPPPYPSRPERAALLRLSEAEMRALAPSIPLVNLTAILRRELEGERRANGPPRAEIALDAETRARCLSVVTVNEAGVTGEVGLLAPDCAGARGVAVYVRWRALCTLKDGPGWPIAAAINDDASPPNRYFDGLRTAAAEVRLQRVARAAAMRALAELITPPPDALGVRWLHGGETGGVGPTVAGAIWLLPAWPREPRVRVRVPGGGGLAAQRSLVAAEAPPSLHGDVPVSGDLLSTADGPWTGLATVALGAALSIVAGAKDASPAALAAYRWDLALLGFGRGEEPKASTADGKTVGAADVLDELAARGHLWITDRQGSADGDFPDAAPAFVLLDAARSPLVAVLRRRAAPGVLRDLGGLVATAVPVPVPTPAHPALAVPPAPAPETSWLTELWDAVRSLLGRDEPLVESALTEALYRVIDALDLTGGPVVEVVEARSGRPLRYEPGPRRLILNPRHEALAWLRPGAPVEERAVILLAAAAVSEINRLLAEVTDAEERRALGALLSRAAGSPR